MKMRCGIIAAMTSDHLIGANGKMPWHYPCDLKRFKQRTLAKPVIMGRKTWDSLLTKPLVGRSNIVVSHNPERFLGIKDVQSFNSIEEAIKACKEVPWVIGGAEIFNLAMPYCDLLDLTIVPDVAVEKKEECVYFPFIDYSKWQAFEQTYLSTDPCISNKIYRFIR